MGGCKQSLVSFRHTSEFCNRMERFFSCDLQKLFWNFQVRFPQKQHFSIQLLLSDRGDSFQILFLLIISTFKSIPAVECVGSVHDLGSHVVYRVYHVDGRNKGSMSWPCEYDDPHFCLFLRSFFQCFWLSSMLSSTYDVSCAWKWKNKFWLQYLGLRRQQLNTPWHHFFSVHAVV